MRGVNERGSTAFRGYSRSSRRFVGYGKEHGVLASLMGGSCVDIDTPVGIQIRDYVLRIGDPVYFERF